MSQLFTEFPAKEASKEYFSGVDQMRVVTEILGSQSFDIPRIKKDKRKQSPEWGALTERMPLANP